MTGGRRCGGGARSVIGTCGIAALALAVAAGGVRAQTPTQSIDLPGQERMDPQMDPYPFDAVQALGHYFRSVLPSGWRIGQPIADAGGFRVLVFVPAYWRGNPTSALMGFCPQPTSNLWRNGIGWVELRAFYRKANAVAITCRPPTG